ncbi:chromosome partitioning protein ParB [Salipiger aestuarii]|uniref:ParB family chromosome partitioning protein n=1 Tax=Salipiger aestuarii TaxID=568098 RepID=A0A327Y308_9RHOB|nr:plasmid partitioning protein RepB [Salipiger aestuarii]EIE50946.1 parB-like partition protein [Citreicella sp. 357]KAA8607740.1 chromosome partitioning protein ParB [Salipiger aestuarii]KAA8609411.1 chromosome partitioning protein ParB [Salipiger aestuarii]KAB2542006.1 chromosome partitioning protein ParB [Salipiger aestuarii]RAK15598.1 ParB family chromosome partitioning protein [Salipiger aestuarii]
MSDTRKKRMSMLDSLAAAGAGGKPGAMMTQNRALRSARDAVDGHRVWDLDPSQIDDDRTRDRLDPADVYDLRESIETTGQSVPILVRRHPSEDGRYLLVYGRRRLEAVRLSDKVDKVRALVATLDDGAATAVQITENMARRDLSFIEKALFAQELVDSGFGNQARVAEVLTVTKSSVSMAIGIAGAVGRDLIEAIGPAHGVGRPRWEALARAIDETGIPRDELVTLANDTHVSAQVSMVRGEDLPDDASVAAFDAVLAHLTAPAPRRPAPPRTTDPGARRALTLGGTPAGSVKRTAKGLALTLNDTDFTDWLDDNAQTVMQELHARWKDASED